MEVVLGALPSVIPKLGQLLADEYNLQKEVKGGIIFLQAELESMKAALEDISKTPSDQLPSGDKIWARNVRELSYDIEDNIDKFMVQVKGHQPAKKQGFKKFIDKTLGSLMQPKIRRKIAIDIRDIKSRVAEVHDRHRRYEVKHSVDKSVKVDPLALVAMVRYKNPTELVGIEESRDEVIKILTEANETSKEQNKIVSIVGFGGLGKTTLANAVFEKLSTQFDCSAFVSVSQTPDMDILFKDMFYQLANYNAASINLFDELRRFLREKRYLVVIDDIWNISNWEMFRCALPDDSVEYRIITTTRNFTVAKEIGGPYKMKPLSLENSRILMYKRIFGKEEKEKCPDQQLEEVSNRILKKCGGVPLAVITIASLLASKGRNKLEWFGVCNSIGAGLVEDNTIENMRKVLSLSYYDMPSHLRTCLLYLSMFPEDYDIRKDRLIWLWIAEGFIQSKKQDKSLFEIGESYLNDLINRSMVQPKHDRWIGMMESCRVHDMVLDLICSLSSEENFVTIHNNMGHSSGSKKVRRLSLQNSKASHGKPEATLSIEHNARSVIVFGSVPTVLENFSILHVLDLEGCDLSQSNSLKYLGNLLHLRYLSLRHTHIDQLPEEIGNLQFLQIVDVESSSWKGSPSLPSSIVGLTQLMSLRIDYSITVPEGIGSLIGLEELLHLCIDCEGKMLEELAHLTQLKVLHFRITTGNSSEACLHKSLVECLNKLQKIHSIIINIKNRECNLDGWVIIAPENLRTLRLLGLCWFATLPAWLKVNPSLLRDLSVLEIRVKRLQQEDLELLGRLPALHSLDLFVSHEDQGIHKRFVVGACSFPCLMHCGLWGFGQPVVFQQGVMPRLRRLGFNFRVQRTREINDSFDLGLGNLPSLQEVYVWVRSGGADVQDVEEAKAAVRHVIEVHPNHPTIRVNNF
ncbi:unnamed protein product [Miscanthus lutarioriparius]|uniref:Uncharacterized protein n=1 Tax=Miscanthus lutarioriparius TaxID=422564 RepID=A0A811RFZ2_9POAL|nr:unnamed protein product [Miscanthus lutarioriparius]